MISTVNSATQQTPIPPRLSEMEVHSFLPNGAVFDMAAPDPKEIDFFWIAKTLSKINRYTGRNKGHGFSVAQHCVLSADYCHSHPNCNVSPVTALLHDAHEAIIGDLITPFVKLMNSMSAYSEINEIVDETKRGWDKAISIAAYGSVNNEYTDYVFLFREPAMQKLDKKMFDIESRHLFGKHAEEQAFYPDEAHLDIHPRTLKPWDARHAEERFLNAFKFHVGEEELLRQRLVFIENQKSKSGELD